MGFILGLAVGLFVGAVSVAAIVGFGSAHDWPAWVQAIGSVLAIAVAVYIPWREREHEKAEAARKSLDELKSRRARICTSLKAEIGAIDVSILARQEAIGRTLESWSKVSAVGKMHPDALRPASPLRFTDGTIYRAAAANLGDLPEPLLKQIVEFYSYLYEIDGLALAGDNQIGYLQNAQTALPRMRMLAAWLKEVIERLERSNYVDAESLKVEREKLIQIGLETGYLIPTGPAADR